MILMRLREAVAVLALAFDSHDVEDVQRVVTDLELLRQPAAFRRKAIVHELLHFKYPNHGRMFRAMERMYTRN